MAHVHLGEGSFPLGATAVDGADENRLWDAFPAGSAQRI